MRPLRSLHESIVTSKIQVCILSSDDYEFLNLRVTESKSELVYGKEYYSYCKL